jgi:hypothetical protein
MKKIISITSHEGNSNQNHNMLSSHHRIASKCNQKDKKYACGNAEKLDCKTLLVAMKMNASILENSVTISHKTRNKTTILPRNFAIEFIISKGKEISM